MQSTVCIENLTFKPLWVRLNTGQHVFIGARERTHALDTVLLQPNTALERLEARGLVRRFAAPAESAPASPAPPITAPAKEPARRRTRTLKEARP